MTIPYKKLIELLEFLLKQRRGAYAKVVNPNNFPDPMTPAQRKKFYYIAKKFGYRGLEPRNKGEATFLISYYEDHILR